MDPGICSGKDKAVVPWSAIVQSQDDFVARMYLPADVDLKEPSKLQNWDTTALLNFWYARQEKDEGPTFLFKAWKNKDGDMVPSVLSGKSPTPQTRVVRKQHRVTIRRPRDSSTELSSDGENIDDVDDDLADGRSPQKKPRYSWGPATKGTEVRTSIPKPRKAKPATSGALLTSRMGDLLAGLTAEATGDGTGDVDMDGTHTSPAPKRKRGKKAVVEPSARTTRSKSQMPVDSTPRVTRARGRR